MASATLYEVDESSQESLEEENTDKQVWKPLVAFFLPGNDGVLDVCLGRGATFWPLVSGLFAGQIESG